ncbi:MAG: hypothetical protein EPN19_06335 [Betaproteobacteria bacterium]|nr:MAG: hypothetical protein EPN19_06335 [Betaproteobacteria bacterium]
MRGLARILIVLLLLAALPLRGYAAIAAGLCDAHHSGVAAVKAAVHDHAAGDYGHDGDSGGTDSPEFASVCSLCATCSVGASLAPHAVHAIALAPAGASAIPFYGYAASGRVPGTLDRPPLPL